MAVTCDECDQLCAVIVREMPRLYSSRTCPMVLSGDHMVPTCQIKHDFQPMNRFLLNLVGIFGPGRCVFTRLLCHERERESGPRNKFGQ